MCVCVHAFGPDKLRGRCEHIVRVTAIGEACIIIVLGNSDYESNEVMLLIHERFPNHVIDFIKEAHCTRYWISASRNFANKCQYSTKFDGKPSMQD